MATDTQTGEKTAEELEEEARLRPGLTAAKKVAADEVVAAKDGSLDADDAKTVHDATNWLLSSFEEAVEVRKTLKLNVGTSRKPHWLAWEIRAVEGAMLRRIRARAAESVQQSGRGAGLLGDAEAAFRANLECVVEGTVTPNVRELAMGRGLADPAIFVEEAFKNKQGLIDQISAEIMDLSGYSDDDVRDALEVRAAGNS